MFPPSEYKSLIRTCYQRTKAFDINDTMKDSRTLEAKGYGSGEWEKERVKSVTKTIAEMGRESVALTTRIETFIFETDSYFGSRFALAGHLARNMACYHGINWDQCGIYALDQQIEASKIIINHMREFASHGILHSDQLQLILDRHDFYFGEEPDPGFGVLRQLIQAPSSGQVEIIDQ